MAQSARDSRTVYQKYGIFFLSCEPLRAENGYFTVEITARTCAIYMRLGIISSHNSSVTFSPRIERARRARGNLARASVSRLARRNNRSRCVLLSVKSREMERNVGRSWR